jgi:hypothetical protein
MDDPCRALPDAGEGGVADNQHGFTGFDPLEPLTDSITFPLVWERIALQVPMRRLPESLHQRWARIRTSG